jgi:hypothetical protein
MEVLTVEEPPPEPSSTPLLEWVQQGDNGFNTRVHPTATGHGVWIDGVGWFDVDPTTRRIRMASVLPVQRSEAALWGVPAALCIGAHGHVPLHAASVEVEGRGLVIAAPGRFGKTTLASAFLARGGRLLSEDLTCVTLASPPAILPGPALARLRPDSYQRLAFPGTRVVFETKDRVYLEMDESIRGTSDPVPLFGIVFLRIQPHEIHAEPLDPVKALPDLWNVTFKLPTDSDRARCFQGLVDLMPQVRLWNLYRPLDFTRTDLVMDTLMAMCRG